MPAHNGVIYNDKKLHNKCMMLPDTKIETDRYIVVQLLEYFSAQILKTSKKCQNLRKATILRTDGTLFLVKGCNPLTLYPSLIWDCMRMQAQK